MIVGRRASREYVAATRCLDRAERAQAIVASVRGDVPASAAVLVAAIRIAHLRLGFGRSTPNRIAVSYVLLTVSWLALTATNADGPGRMVLKGVGAAFLAVAGVRGWLVARRVERRIILLQDALQRFPGAAAALRTARRNEPASPRWRPTVALLTAVVLVTTGALAAVYLAHRQSPDCRTANDMARFVASHPDMLDPAFIPANSGGPTLADYQLWSEQLDRYAALWAATSLRASAAPPPCRLGLQRWSGRRGPIRPTGRIRGSNGAETTTPSSPPASDRSEGAREPLPAAELTPDPPNIESPAKKRVRSGV
nr:hypothetical protein [Mycobacterium lepraemurium]